MCLAAVLRLPAELRGLRGAQETPLGDARSHGRQRHCSAPLSRIKRPPTIHMDTTTQNAPTARRAYTGLGGAHGSVVGLPPAGRRGDGGLSCVAKDQGRAMGTCESGGRGGRWHVPSTVATIDQPPARDGVEAEHEAAMTEEILKEKPPGNAVLVPPTWRVQGVAAFGMVARLSLGEWKFHAKDKEGGDEPKPVDKVRRLYNEKRTLSCSRSTSQPKDNVGADLLSRSTLADVPWDLARCQRLTLQSGDKATGTLDAAAALEFPGAVRGERPGSDAHPGAPGGIRGSTTEMGHAVQAVHAPVLPGDLLMAAQITRDSINQWMGPAGMLAAFFSFLRKDTTSVDKRGAWNPRGPCDWSHAITDARRVADSDLG
ncbi:hypothetical protein CYMTET_53888 [Cymbomonas tetramitiformis]|uniref:Uncharacterized protein n=1 Tax=Cymbomonas tetramitiformis TaxID=36881 RepID=A0AAE0BG64_9CHLO|nr:hypothetical protein CYMTET_53888 [Cymbomonas tetramitiformis]